MKAKIEDYIKFIKENCVLVREDTDMCNNEPYSEWRLNRDYGFFIYPTFVAIRYNYQGYRLSNGFHVCAYLERKVGIIMPIFVGLESDSVILDNLNLTIEKWLMADDLNTSLPTNTANKKKVEKI